VFSVWRQLLLPVSLFVVTSCVFAFVGFVKVLGCLEEAGPV